MGERTGGIMMTFFLNLNTSIPLTPRYSEVLPSCLHIQVLENQGHVQEVPSRNSSLSKRKSSLEEKQAESPQLGHECASWMCASNPQKNLASEED